MNIKIHEYIYFTKNYWLSRLSKIMSPRIAGICFKIWGICVIFFFLFLLLPNRSFYNENISGKVYEIKKEYRDWKVKLDSTWYLVQMPGIDSISIGNTIVKPKKSYNLTIYNERNQIKYKQEIKNITFKKIEPTKYSTKK